MEMIHSDFDFSTHFHVKTAALNVHNTKVNWKNTDGFQKVEQKKKSEKGEELLSFASFDSDALKLNVLQAAHHLQKSNN